MLLSSGPDRLLILVDKRRCLPRVWATAYAALRPGQAINTQKNVLRHLGAFYDFTDDEYGIDSLDKAISEQEVRDCFEMATAFRLVITADATLTTYTLQRWDSITSFLIAIAEWNAAESNEWQWLTKRLQAVGPIRDPNHGQFHFGRALPRVTLSDLLEVARPQSERNPYKSADIQDRNWLLLNIYLECGLRRGEALLLREDSLKADFDESTGKLVSWLDIRNDPAILDNRSNKPSLKTGSSRRSVTVTAGIVALYERYLSCHRATDGKTGYLFTSSRGNALSAESVAKIFKAFTKALSPTAKKRFYDHTGGKESVSPHDLRHTCANILYSTFLADCRDRELTFQKMRVFFGWARDSDMPSLYARSAITSDLMDSWNDAYTSHRSFLARAEL